MFTSVIANSVIVVGVATLAAGLVVLTSVAPDAKAESQVEAALVKGSVCSSRGWPHYEQSCQFDLRSPANAARTIRVIAVR